MSNNFDLAFSKTVKDIQLRKGSRVAYARMAEHDDERTVLNEDLITFIEQQKSAYFATASIDGQPYIQHRGGPAGFLRVLDNSTIAFADFKGNRQFISQGNLSENPKAYIFLMDYTKPRRLKLWGDATVVEDDEELMESLMPEHYKAQPEQVIIFKLKLWDLNCRQHIPHLVDQQSLAAVILEKDRRIAELEATVELLRNKL